MAVDEELLARANALGVRLANDRANPWAGALWMHPRASAWQAERLIDGKPSSPEPRVVAPVGGLSEVARGLTWMLLASILVSSLLTLLLFRDAYGVAMSLSLMAVSIWLMSRKVRRARARPVVQGEWDRWRLRTQEQRSAVAQEIERAYVARLAARRESE